MKSKSIKEIEAILVETKTVEARLLNELKNDSRKGVQLLLTKWEKKLEIEDKLRKRFNIMKEFDEGYYQKGPFLAGIDEVGRGPLAGPVIAAAVILDNNFYLPGINDSKQLTKKQRDEYYDYIMKHALSVGVGIVGAAEIDVLNIYEATKKAMLLAVENLHITPNYLLVDAMVVPIPIAQEKVIKGDQKSIAIAASSIVAKVTRDQMMCEMGEKFPQYGFDKHMGYGTAQHIDAINKFGVLKEHRRSFSPIKEMAIPLHI